MISAMNSLIVPAHNESAEIGACLESIHAGGRDGQRENKCQALMRCQPQDVSFLIFAYPDVRHGAAPSFP
jgi:hypothetical protein